MEQSRIWIEIAAHGALAVAMMVALILIGTMGWFLQTVKKIEGALREVPYRVGKTLLVGLELLVAADIINTVAFALTLPNPRAAGWPGVGVDGSGMDPARRGRGSLALPTDEGIPYWIGERGAADHCSLTGRRHARLNRKPTERRE